MLAKHDVGVGAYVAVVVLGVVVVVGGGGGGGRDFSVWGAVRVVAVPSCYAVPPIPADPSADGDIGALWL